MWRSLEQNLRELTIPPSQSWLAILFPCCIQTLSQMGYELHWGTLRGMLRCLSSTLFCRMLLIQCRMCRLGSLFVSEPWKAEREDFSSVILNGPLYTWAWGPKGPGDQGTKEVRMDWKPTWNLTWKKMDNVEWSPGFGIRPSSLSKT